VRSRSFIAVAVLLAVIAGGIAAVGIFDARAHGHIAKGVKVAGVDVGGLTPAQARAKVHRALLLPLGAPIVVHHDRKSWQLPARQARISANVSAMVDAAMDRSTRDSILVRAWREATGGRIGTDLRARVSFDRGAVHRLVSRIEQSINRQPKDATVDFSGDGVSKVESKTGLAVRAQQLEDQIMHAIALPGAPRRFVARTRKLQPKVTSNQLEDRYPAAIIVNRQAFRLMLFKHLKLVKTYPVAIGRQGLETPAGLYDVQSKQVNPSWHVPNSDWAGKLAGRVIPPGPEDPLKARWIGFNGGAGIHGTDDDGSIGSAASHGCVRMHIPDVIDLYKQVDVGNPVYIA
jgi:lipoprotein-anchoring transpeptidase ErfK/SrfK